MKRSSTLAVSSFGSVSSFGGHWGLKFHVRFKFRVKKNLKVTMKATLLSTTVLQQTHSSLHRIWSDFLVKLRDCQFFGETVNGETEIVARGSAFTSWKIGESMRSKRLSKQQLRGTFNGNESWAIN